MWIRSVDLVVVMHGKDSVHRIFVRVDVDHPAKDDGMEAAARSVASPLRGNGAAQAKLGPVGVARLGAGRHAEVRVQMPGRYAQRDALVELLFGGALGHGVHRAHQFVARRSFLVQQGSGTRRFERERFEEAIPVIREVIFGLRKVGQENLVPVGESDVIVPVLLDAVAQLIHDFPGACEVFGSLRARTSCVHVGVVRRLPGCHVVNGMGFAGFGLVHIHPGHRGIHALGLLLKLRSRRLLGFLLCGRRVVAGHGGQQNGDNKERAKQHAELRGELSKLTAGWHSNFLLTE